MSAVCATAGLAAGMAEAGSTANKHVASIKIAARTVFGLKFMSLFLMFNAAILGPKP